MAEYGIIEVLVDCDYFNGAFEPDFLPENTHPRYNIKGRYRVIEIQELIVITERIKNEI